ncbi:MAG: ATP-dependent metallopeptidase FtsH/Yme1/Tma family protein, partial [Actinomycetota bacterium]
MANGNDDRRSSGRWQGFDLGGGSGNRRRWQFTLGYILLGLLVLFVLQSLFVPQPEAIDYSRFLQLVEEGQVERVAISETEVAGNLRNGTDAGFVAVRPPGIDEQELLALLREHDVEFTGQQPSAFSNFLFSWILPILVLVAIWGFVFR